MPVSEINLLSNQTNNPDSNALLVDQYISYLLGSSEPTQSNNETNIILLNDCCNDIASTAITDSGSTKPSDCSSTDSNSLDLNCGNNVDFLNYLVQKNTESPDETIMTMISGTKDEAIKQLGSYQTGNSANSNIDTNILFWQQQVRNQEQIILDLQKNLGNINSYQEIAMFFDLYQAQEKLLQKGTDLPNNLELFKLRLLMQTLITQGSVDAVHKLMKLLEKDKLFELLMVEMSSHKTFAQQRVESTEQKIKELNHQLAAIYAQMNLFFNEDKGNQQAVLKSRAQELESHLSRLYSTL
jgi:hypothetical protein